MKNMPVKKILPCACIVYYPAFFFEKDANILTLTTCQHRMYLVSIIDGDIATFDIPIDDAATLYLSEPSHEKSVSMGKYKVFYKGGQYGRTLD